MHLAIIITFILLATFLINKLSRQIKIPPVVGLIIGGIILGAPFFKSFTTASDLNTIFWLGDLGLLCLMFLAGMETKSSALKLELKDATLIAVSASVTPFLLGFIALQLLGFSLLISFVVGVCMSITAEATKARVLLGLNKLKTKIGTLMMEAGVIDDILGMGIFILITFLFGGVNLRENIFLVIVVIAFFIGISIQKKVDTNQKGIKILKKTLLIGIVPFFFISMGSHFEWSSLSVNPSILIIILVLAFLGKIFGVLLVRPFSKLSCKQLYLIGWAMNSRGALELALALVAFRSGIIPASIYSSLILMALVTTITFPFVITHMINKQPQIMD